MAKRATIRGLPQPLLDQVAETLRVIAHPVRLKIIELLMRHELSVGELADHLKIPPSIVSQHLTHLRAHGVLTRRREGRQAYYEVDHPAAVGVLQCIQRQHQTNISFQDGEAI
jgi:DNA-binding transcriptional ArsR family regulator